MEKASTFVRLDIHRKSIEWTIAEAGAAGEMRHFGTRSQAWALALNAQTTPQAAPPPDSPAT